MHGIECAEPNCLCSQSRCVHRGVLCVTGKAGRPKRCFYVCRLLNSSWLWAVTEAVFLTRICTLHNGAAKAGFRQMDVDPRTAAHIPQVQHFRENLHETRLRGTIHEGSLWVPLFAV